MTRGDWLRIQSLHEWDISPREAAAVQNKLRGLAVPEWDDREIRRIAGADVSFPSRNEILAAACVMSFPDLKLLDYSVVRRQCVFPYVPGLLAFREIPAVLDALENINVEPDVILCDAQGLAHPRGMGLATHLGILIDRPTVGCAKSRLFGSYEEPGSEKGDHSLLLGDKGEVIGAVVTTRSGVKPVFVSIGNRVDLEISIRVVLHCCPKYRLPEPARVAHKLAAGEKFEIESEHEEQSNLF
jgi:deoxyribonuclease V